MLKLCCCPPDDTAPRLAVDIECSNITCCSTPPAVLQRFPSEFIRRCRRARKGKRTTSQGSDAVVEDRVGIHVAQACASEIPASTLHDSKDGHAMASGSSGDAALCPNEQGTPLPTHCG